MKPASVAVIVKAANQVALCAVDIEREVESTSEIQELVNTLYETADEIRALAEGA